MTGTKPCIFCGRTGIKLTKEHAIPRWVSKALRTRELGGVTHTLGREGLYPRGAPELDMKLRHVCGPCNNGWLAELERSVRVVLLNPIRGLPSDPIPVKAHRPVAVWALKTWLLAQHVSASQPGNTGFPLQPEVFRLMHDRKEPPETAAVWVGAINSAATGMVLRVGTLRVIKPAGQIVGLNGVLSIGSVLFVVYMPAWLASDPKPVDIYGMEVRAEVAPYVRRIWPSDVKAVEWPPGQVLSVDDAERLWPDNMTIKLQGLPGSSVTLLEGVENSVKS